MLASSLIRQRLLAPRYARTVKAADFSTQTPVATANIFQRMSSFLVGAGLCALATQFYIYQEIRTGNALMIAKQAELEKRLRKLEK
ncbi:hypothetical protein FisN_7Lh218 [Fistulifera solaris]|uniref:Uncharacterized protein n=1 Tax=Fistulifera solaris TaxID=1519565 RepID=A0A1Z5JRL7_FISSO|nr:hypothetical protein FisN_7Lh218 [Fistulifera solaris]|eukprot:GAX16502.1 hypothetical protein FisN_7Lh218 [Fistulifera solaris]